MLFADVYGSFVDIWGFLADIQGSFAEMQGSVVDMHGSARKRGYGKGGGLLWKEGRRRKNRS